MSGLVDVHTHVVPAGFPESPNAASDPHWPCMRTASPSDIAIWMGSKRFRKLDDRSWNAARRLEDMDRDGVAVQVLSPMPELLAYWIRPDDAERLCDHVNARIAALIAHSPARFRGLGAVPLQDPERAARYLARCKQAFGLSGVEIGSNISGVMLGDRSLDPFYTTAESLGMCVFVHALHPIATRAPELAPSFVPFVGFPLDVAMAGASLIVGGTLDRFPMLRIGLSHGGGALGSILGRLDLGWQRTAGFGHGGSRSPSQQAKTFFYDSNVYDSHYLGHLIARVAPGQVCVGTDYPFDIMQQDPQGFVDQLSLAGDEMLSLRRGAAGRFLNDLLV
jgi:aminocarboxymuconate-semialdehyde decarboxylase